MTITQTPDSRRSGRRARLAPVALACAAVLVGGCSAAGRTEVLAPPGIELATATIVRQDLVTRDEYRGRLGHGDAVPLVSPTEGTVTALPEVGSVIARGDVIAEIDGIPMRLLFGDRPAWRRLGVTDTAAGNGPDVRQLNDNLAALGYAAREDLPDERFDWRTRDAVRRWQEAVGRPPTGALDLGEVAFMPDVIRIGEVASHRGARVGAGQILAMVTGTEQLVRLALEAADRSTMREGQPVSVVLPDRTEAPATVFSIGRVASSSDGAEEAPTIEIAIAFDEALPDGFDLDAAPVGVEVDRVLAEDVLVVPVGALVAITGGGYAVERVIEGGATEQVAVQPGEFADGSVAVSGEIAEGDDVVVPS